MGIGIRSVRLGEKKGDTTHLESVKIHRRDERNGFAFFPLNTLVVLIQGLRASGGFENLYVHKMEIGDYKEEK